MIMTFHSHQTSLRPTDQHCMLINIRPMCSVVTMSSFSSSSASAFYANERVHLLFITNLLFSVMDEKDAPRKQE